MQLASNLAHTEAVRDALNAALTALGQPDKVGISARRRWDEAQSKYVVLEPPCMIVDDFASGEMAGPVADPHDDATLVYQVRCVGSGPEQALWLVDVARTTLLAGITVNDRRVFLRPNPGSAGPHVDNDVQPPVFVAYPMFRVLSVPA